jgi:hypothetical protein
VLLEYCNALIIFSKYFTLECLCFSCRAVREDAEGCRDVTSGLQGAGLQLSLDPDRELERIHSLFATHLDRLNKLQGEYLYFENFQII